MREMGFMERLLRNSKVEDGHWIWTGPKQKSGHGYIGLRVDGKTKQERAYRWVYENMVGPIPPGLEIDHLCFIPECVFPDHLEPTTHAENMRRAFARKVNCPRGHPYDYVKKSGGRGCRTCDKERAQQRLSVARQEINARRRELYRKRVNAKKQKIGVE